MYILFYKVYGTNLLLILIQIPLFTNNKFPQTETGEQGEAFSGGGPDPDHGALHGGDAVAVEQVQDG